MDLKDNIAYSGIFQFGTPHGCVVLRVNVRKKITCNVTFSFLITNISLVVLRMVYQRAWGLGERCSATAF